MRDGIEVKRDGMERAGTGGRHARMRREVAERVEAEWSGCPRSWWGERCSVGRKMMMMRMMTKRVWREERSEVGAGGDPVLW